MKHLSALIASFVLIASFSVTSFGWQEKANISTSDWPSFRGPQRDGRSSTTAIAGNWSKKKPSLVRTIQGAGNGFASLCVGDGKIFTTGNSFERKVLQPGGNAATQGDKDANQEEGDSKKSELEDDKHDFQRSQFVVCFDQKTGAVNWRKNLVDVWPNHAVMGSRSTPAYAENRLYVISSDGQLFCLDTENDGQIIWRKSFQKDFGGRLMSGWGFSESPLIDGDRVVVTPGGEDALVVALNRRDGTVIWKARLDETQSQKNMAQLTLNDGAGYASMIKVEKGVSQPQYVQFVGRGLIGIDCETGKVLWRHSDCASRTSNICSPVVSVNRIAYSAAPKGGLAIIELGEQAQPFRPLQVHRENSLACHHGGMVVHKGHLFFGAGENRGLPTCVDMSTGKRKWGGTFRGPGRGSAAVIYVDEKIIFRYQNGVVAMIEANPEQYVPLGSFTQSVESENQSWAYPVVVDKQLLLREHDKIMVYDLK